MVIGSIYYMPALLGKKMVDLTHVYVERSPSRAMMLQVVISLLAMTVLAVIIQMTGATGAMAGATVGFWVWLIVALSDAGRANFSGSTWSLWLINQGNWIITYVAAGAVIGALS
jgi:hypothetical protein